MTERQLVDKILRTDFLQDKFGKKNIKKIHREYKVGNGKNVDLAVETLDFMYLIEVKVDLISYDIGQIMSYMVSFKSRTFKRIKGILLYYKINPKELNLLEDIINTFDIDIQLMNTNTKLKFNDNSFFEEKLNKVIKIINKLSDDEKIKLNDIYSLMTRYEWDKAKKLLIKEGLIYIDKKQCKKNPQSIKLVK